jgi:hypothetical protein
VRSQAEYMSDTLKDTEMTGLILLCLAEELPVTETEETMRWLAKEDVAVLPTLMANRVLDELVDPATPPGPVGEAARLHRALWGEQQEWLLRLPPDHSIPYFFGLFTPGEVAAHMADQFEAMA